MAELAWVKNNRRARNRNHPARVGAFLKKTAPERTSSRASMCLVQALALESVYRNQPVREEDLDEDLG